MGQDPLAIALQGATLTLPGGTLSLTGSLQLLGLDIGCGTRSRSDQCAGRAPPRSFSVRRAKFVPLIPGYDRLQLSLGGIGGSFTDDLTSGTVRFCITTATASLQLNATGVGVGGASLTLTVANGAVTTSNVAPGCNPGTGAADLGWLTAQLGNFQIQSLAYQPGAGFTFAAQVDVTPALPSIQGIELPSALGVSITNTGFTIPDENLAVTQPGVTIPGIGVGVTLTSVHLPGFTLSWNDWQAKSANGFQFSLVGNVTLPSLPQAPCLSAQPLQVTATLASGTITATIANQTFSARLAYTLAAGATLQIQQVGGTLGVQLSPLALTQLPSIQGALVLPSLFTVPAGTSQQMSLGTSLQLSPGGGITGQITGLSTPCPIFSRRAAGEHHEPTLAFTFANGPESVSLSGTASATFPPRARRR